MHLKNSVISHKVEHSIDKRRENGKCRKMSEYCPKPKINQVVQGSPRPENIAKTILQKIREKDPR